MTDTNRLTIIGRLTRDAEINRTKTGMAIVKFSIAVNRNRKNGDQWEDEVNYFDIVSLTKQAERLAQYLVKGKQVAIDGELKQDRWQDKETGQNRSKVELIASYIQLLGDRKQPEESDNYNAAGVNW
jgi:single-strand DNA-binding protein